MTVKNMAKYITKSSNEAINEKYRFVEYRENELSPPKTNFEKEEFDFVKVVDLKPDVSSLHIIENVDLTNAKEVENTKYSSIKLDLS